MRERALCEVVSFVGLSASEPAAGRGWRYE